MKQGLNLVQVLRDSRKTRKQITGSYLDFNENSKKIEGYCAMGALFCESDNVTDIGTIQCGDYLLFQCYGIKFDYSKKYICPKCDIELHLSGLIIHLNDVEGRTFEEIAEVLEKLKL